MIAVIKAGLQHTDAFLSLLGEIERHYGNAPADDEARAVTNALALLDASVGRCVLIAFHGQKAIGFGTLYAMFPGERLMTQCYMKELFVSDGWRGAGVGEALLRFAAKLVSVEGGSRLDLVADAANVPAQAFYEKLGAKIVPRIYYRYDGASLNALATASQ